MFNATVEQFKAQFPRFSPMYLPEYKYGKTYFQGDVVYYLDLFYKCKAISTINAPNNTTDWELYNDSVLNYTTDTDIEEAFEEANINFNSSLFGDCSKALTAFLFLAAHYLTIDFRNALGTNQIGLVTSKSVGSVSEGYTIPAWLTKSAALSVYASTGYGIKYATLLRPYLIGNVFVVKGSTTHGN